MTHPEPFTRRCICPDGPRQPPDHDTACNTTYREEFMAYRTTWTRRLYEQHRRTH